MIELVNIRQTDRRYRPNRLISQSVILIHHEGGRPPGSGLLFRSGPGNDQGKPGMAWSLGHDFAFQRPLPPADPVPAACSGLLGSSR